MANNRILDIAMQIRAARAVDEHMDAERMALDQTLQTSTDSVRAIRDEMVEVQAKILESHEGILKAQAQSMESQQTLIDSIVDLVSVIGDRMKDPVEVNVPETVVNVAPAEITIPKPPAQIKPVINVEVKMPEQKIEKATSKLPKRITIAHSDGTSSTIELK